jgi:hypothetical protein
MLLNLTDRSRSGAAAVLERPELLAPATGSPHCKKTCQPGWLTAAMAVNNKWSIMSPSPAYLGPLQVGSVVCSTDRTAW